MSTPRIDFFFWRECPSWERTLADLRAAMAESGLDPEQLEIHEVGTEADAEREAFPGSPTIRIDGVDIEPPGPDEAPGLSCRVYRRRDGRVSPMPDPDSLREALTRIGTK